MMSKWEYFIISLLAVLIGIMICTFQEVWEIRKYIEAFNDNPNISSEFAYVKDFMDRNIEYFSVFTGVTVAVVSILVGLVFTFKFDGEINAMRRDFVVFREDQCMRNKDQDKEFREVKANLAYGYKMYFELYGSENFELSLVFLSESIKLMLASDVENEVVENILIPSIDRAINQLKKAETINTEIKVRFTKRLKNEKCSDRLSQKIIKLLSAIDDVSNS